MDALNMKDPQKRLEREMYCLDMAIAIREDADEIEPTLNMTQSLAVGAVVDAFMREGRGMPSANVIPVVPTLLHLIYGYDHSRRMYLWNIPRWLLTEVSSIVTDSVGDDDLTESICRFDVLRKFLQILIDSGYRSDLTRTSRYLDDLERRTMKRVTPKGLSLV